jgi:hypothetical protein
MIGLARALGRGRLLPVGGVLLLAALSAYAVARQFRADIRTLAYDFINRRTSLHEVTSRDVADYIARHGLAVPGQAPVRPASGPLRVHPANPRYFADASGRPVYLTGSHTWLSLQDGVLTEPPPAFDYDTYLDFLEAHHFNFFRLWLWEEAKWIVEWQSPYYFAPMPFARPGPGVALDGKPRFDLTRFDDAYFDRLRARVIAAGERGVYVSVMLFNGWSVEYPKGHFAFANPWLGHPFNARNNVNGVDGDPNGDGSGAETHSLALAPVIDVQDAYVRKVVDTVNDLDNVLYEISNESPAGSATWQYRLIRLIRDYEATKPKQHPIGMTVEFPAGRNDDLFASPADWISPNDYFDPPPSDGRKVIVADTDHIWGIGGDRRWAWKAFTRGLNPIFMDQYDDGYKLAGGGYDLANANDVSLRRNLGFTRRFAERLDLAAMTPRGGLASTGYALVSPSGPDATYLVYLPDGGTVEVDLSASPGPFEVEWFDPATGRSETGAVLDGGAPRQLRAPFADDAVLYLRRVG